MKKRTKKLPGSSRTESGRRLRTRNATLAYFRRHWLFYAMLILPVLYYFLFCYRAMPGVVIAFKNYNMFTGIWDSPWVGMEFFKRVAQSDPFLAFRTEHVGSEYPGTGSRFSASYYSGSVSERDHAYRL